MKLERKREDVAGQCMRSWNGGGQNSAGSLKAIVPVCVHTFAQCNSQKDYAPTHTALVSMP